MAEIVFLPVQSNGRLLSVYGGQLVRPALAGQRLQWPDQYLLWTDMSSKGCRTPFQMLILKTVE